MNASQPTKPKTSPTNTFPQILATLVVLAAIKFGLPLLTKAMLRQAGWPQPAQSTPLPTSFDPAAFERTHHTLEEAIKAAENWRSSPPGSWQFAPLSMGTGGDGSSPNMPS